MNHWSSAQLADFASRVGVPFAVLLVVLFELGPKIDRGIQIADHVDAELQFLAARGCAPSALTVNPFGMEP